jgi:hypothetical protein
MTLVAVLAESILRSAMLAGVVGLMLATMRIASPGVRHAAWTSVLVVMLAMPWLVRWGPVISAPVLPDVAAQRLARPSAHTIEIGGTDRIAALPSSPFTVEFSWADGVAAVYLAGLVAFLLRLVSGMRQVRQLVRAAVLDEGFLTHPRCSTPITVGLLRPVAMLPPEWRAYSRDQLRTIVIHEGEHIRRRDPLIQGLALLNRTVFWCHPLAWWLERHLSELADQACDAAVLASGSDPRAYAQQLVDLARVAAQAGGRVVPLSLAMARTGLPKRVRLLLSDAVTPPPSRLRLTWMVVLSGALGVAVATSELTSATAATQRHRPRTSVVSALSVDGARGFGVVWRGRLRAHGSISDQDRMDAAKRAHGSDHVWLRTGELFVVLTDRAFVSRAFDLYERADACPEAPTGRGANTANDHPIDGCAVSPSELEAARDAPDFMPGLSLHRKARMQRVVALLESASIARQAPRVD